MTATVKQIVNKRVLTDTGLGDDPLARPPMGPLRFDVLVELLEAAQVKDPKTDEPIPAYEVTLKAILPETVAAVLMAHVVDRRISVRVGRPGIEEDVE